MQLTRSTRSEQFDNKNYMKYNPDFHFSHKQPFSESDLEYLCKFAETDGFSSIGYALGKTASSCNTMYNKLKKRGLIDYYKSLGHWV